MNCNTETKLSTGDIKHRSARCSLHRQMNGQDDSSACDWQGARH